MGEFRVQVGVRRVAAGRDIEIVDGDTGRRAGVVTERDRDVARVAALADLHTVLGREGMAREDRDAVIALLAAWTTER